VTDTRELAHQLIDRLPDAQLSGLVQFLETIVDPVSTALRNAPLDDEPETEDEEPLLLKPGRGSRTTVERAFLTPRPCEDSDWSSGDRMDRDSLG
jgi:hypothetical protein